MADEAKATQPAGKERLYSYPIYGFCKGVCRVVTTLMFVVVSKFPE